MNDSGLFLEPFPKTKCSKRKRKCDDGDIQSLSDFDTSIVQDNSFQKRKRLSLASLLSPVSQVKKVGTALQRSWSGIRISQTPHKFSTCEKETSLSSQFKTSSMLNLHDTKYNKRNSIATYMITKSNCPRPTKRRLSCLWIETLPYATMKHVKEKLSHQEICHQETIYELLQGEEDIIEDLMLVQQIYHDSLLHLGILTSDEIQQIFGCFQELIPLHQALVKKLKALQGDYGAIHSIGDAMISWVPGLKAYELYCSNLIKAKDMLDERKIQDKRLEDFLQRCLESPFSRKLDLWNFLDVPRNRLVKYPLLLQRILKQTGEHNVDRKILPKVITNVEQIIRVVNKSIGQANCQFVLEKLDFIQPQQKNFSLENSSSLLCSGTLKNKRGTKLHAFLFNNAFVLTRQATRCINNVCKTVFQVYREPIPTNQLMVTDMKDGETRIGGSFQNTFSSNRNIAKNIFSVSYADEENGYCYILQADNEHNKKQWMKHLMDLNAPCPNIEKNNDNDGFSHQSVLKECNHTSYSGNNKFKSITSTVSMNNKIMTRSSSNLLSSLSK